MQIYRELKLTRWSNSRRDVCTKCARAERRGVVEEHFPCGEWEVSFVPSSLAVCQPADPHKTGITAASPVG